MVRSMNEQEMRETIGESWYDFGFVLGALIVIVAAVILIG
jgi:uncharacterized membrane protein